MKNNNSSRLIVFWKILMLGNIIQFKSNGKPCNSNNLFTFCVGNLLLLHSLLLHSERCRWVSELCNFLQNSLVNYRFFRRAPTNPIVARWHNDWHRQNGDPIPRVENAHQTIPIPEEGFSRADNGRNNHGFQQQFRPENSSTSYNSSHESRSNDGLPTYEEATRNRPKRWGTIFNLKTQHGIESAGKVA